MTFWWNFMKFVEFHELHFEVKRNFKSRASYSCQCGIRASVGAGGRGGVTEKNRRRRPQKKKIQFLMTEMGNSLPSVPWMQSPFVSVSCLTSNWSCLTYTSVSNSDAAQDRTCTVRAVVRSGHRTTARAVKKIEKNFFLSLFVPLWPLSSSKNLESPVAGPNYLFFYQKKIIHVANLPKRHMWGVFHKPLSAFPNST